MWSILHPLTDSERSFMLFYVLMIEPGFTDLMVWNVKGAAETFTCVLFTCEMQTNLRKMRPDRKPPLSLKDLHWIFVKTLFLCLKFHFSTRYKFGASHIVSTRLGSLRKNWCFSFVLIRTADQIRSITVHHSFYLKWINAGDVMTTLT